MILAIILTFVSTALVITTAAYLYQKARVRVMKTDVIVALSTQATESYRSGYMRGMLDEKAKTKKALEDILNVHATV